MSEMQSSFSYQVYRGADDLAAMQQALASWIQEVGSCGYDHVGDLPHRIYNGLRGRYPRHELIRLWYVDGQLEGFAQVYPRHKLYDVLISPKYRSTALEIDALNWAYDTLRIWMNQEDNEGKDVETGVYTCDTQRINCLTELGYQPDESTWMIVNERSLDTDLPDAILPEGYSIRSVIDEGDAEQLAAVHHGAFGSEWSPEIYRDEVMRKPGYDPELEHIVVAPDGTFAAFCITWLDTVNSIGLFEPVGTHKAHQRKGLGRALLSYGLRFMREQGMKTAQVCSESDNPAANALYQAVGFVPTYTIIDYQRH